VDDEMTQDALRASKTVVLVPEATNGRKTAEEVLSSDSDVVAQRSAEDEQRMRLVKEEEIALSLRLIREPLAPADPWEEGEDQ
jgi:hypothetical protein